MVQLPRLSGPDAMALGEQLLSAARPHGEVLDRPVTRALTALTTRHGALKVVLRDQGTPEVEPGTSAVPAHRGGEPAARRVLAAAVPGGAGRAPPRRRAACLDALVRSRGPSSCRQASRG